jgi:hypothetical protein
MTKTVSIAVSVALLAMSTFSATAAPRMRGPNQGNPVQQQQFVMNWCSTHPSDPSCNDFRSRHSHWTNNDYGNWYQSHRNTNGFDPLAAGIFGFVAGALVTGAANASAGSSHVAACESAYRSYNVSTDSYLGYDGVRHRCTL